MMQETNKMEADAAIPFVLLHDNQHENIKKQLKQLKSSVLVIGIILGVALQSLSWAARASSKTLLGDNDVGRWLDLFFTLVSLLLMPMILLELIRTAFSSALQLSSRRVDEDVFEKLLIHIQSRLGVGVLMGVLLTLPILDFQLKLWHHLLFTAKIGGMVTLWCCYLENKVLDEPGTLQLAAAVKEQEDSLLPVSVW